MQHLSIRKAGILLAKAAFLLCGLLAIWIFAGIVEHLDQWWLYLLAAAGSAFIGLLILDTAAKAEHDPDNDATRIGGGR